MKLLVVGSRGLKHIDVAPFVPEDTTLIISGGANGIDMEAEKYADRKRLSKIILRPEYSKFGKAAPLKRNETMVEMCDSVLAIWDGQSKGTLYTINYAKKSGKPVKIIEM